jgi:signal peptidase I
MFSFFSKERRERSYLSEVIEHCWKQLRRDHDLLSTDKEAFLRTEIQKAQNVLTAEGTDIPKATEKLVDSYQRCFPQPRAAFWRENGEVILVAIVVAAAVQAYFLKPFKIPTGSMQPTLNGIISRDLTPRENTFWYRAISFPIFGERIIHHTAKEGGKLHSIRPVKAMPFSAIGPRGFVNILPADAVEFYVGNNKYSLPMSLGQFGQNFPKLMMEGVVFKSGETILSAVVQTGDQLFVDRFTYHFRKPKRGEVFVFGTQNISGVQNPGDYYIKRLAGVPGDTLAIQDPYLHVNGKVPTDPGFQKVMSLQDGYRGYSSHMGPYLSEPGATFYLEKDKYFALGDNSFSSSDSRVWGPVPYENIIGRAFFVYWPFTRHFGRIE